MGIEHSKNESHYLKPFLKWAGGKRWFVSNYKHLIPLSFNRYIEPFLGSGAVFFSLSPEEAILSDSNEDLIDTFRAIKINWKLVDRYLKKHQRGHSKDYYYKIRDSNPRSITSKAAKFIYLNRTCWNGLYRVNKKGQFNVPIGTRSKVVFKDESLNQISDVLQKTKLYSKDFEMIIDLAEKDDFVFVDPPYTVRHNKNGFIKYNEKLFSWADQKRLHETLERAHYRGAKILATNAFHNDIIDLYKDSFQTLNVKRNSSISSKVTSRKKFDELVILNSCINGKAN